MNVLLQEPSYKYIKIICLSDNHSVVNWSLKMSFSIYFTQERKTSPYLIYICIHIQIYNYLYMHIQHIVYIYMMCYIQLDLYNTEHEPHTLSLATTFPYMHSLPYACPFPTKSFIFVY